MTPRPGDRLVSVNDGHAGAITIQVLRTTAGGKVQARVVKHRSPGMRGQKWIIALGTLVSNYVPA